MPEKQGGQKVCGELATPASWFTECALLLVTKGIQEVDVGIAQTSFDMLLPGNYHAPVWRLELMHGRNSLNLWDWIQRHIMHMVERVWMIIHGFPK